MSVTVLYLGGGHFFRDTVCISKNVPSLTGYSFNIHPPIFKNNFWNISPADIQKSATGITFSTTSFLRTLCCSEATVTEMTCTV